jgi:propanol-preferring alcohol dehydrogenase
MSAIQIAFALGAAKVYAVDTNQTKLDAAEQYGAASVNAAETEPVEEIRRHTNGKGVDVALELVGLPETMTQAVRSLGTFGRAAIAGLSKQDFRVSSYRDLLCREAEIIGVSDHLAEELPALLELACKGSLDLEAVVTRTVPLEATHVNETLDHLEKFGGDIRSVICPR